MKQLRAFIIKEAMHIFRDYRTMIVLFLMPVAQILIFGFVISTEINDARIGILDKARDKASNQLTRRLGSSGYFKVERQFTHEIQMEEAFRKGDIQLAVVFSPGFGNNLAGPNGAAVQLVADASNANTAQVLVNYSEGIITGWGMEQKVKSGISPPLTVLVRMFYNPSLQGVFMSIPGIMAMVLILVSAMMTSISITREKEYGSMEVLLISPLKPWQIILGKVAPYVVLSFFNAVTIVVLGVVVFKVPVVGSGFLLMVVNLLYILLSLGLGIFISTVAKNQMVAMFISMFGLMLPTILLSGFIYPIENMPKVLQGLSFIMPPRWYIQAVKTIMLKGGGLFYVWKEMLMMSAFLVVFLSLSIKNFKVRLE